VPTPELILKCIILKISERFAGNGVFGGKGNGSVLGLPMGHGQETPNGH